MKEAFISQVNKHATARTPFFFLVDFEKEKPRVWTTEELDAKALLFQINGNTNAAANTPAKGGEWTTHPLPKTVYAKGYNIVIDHLKKGDSYLTNLTFPTPISGLASLEKLFYQAQAPYKLWLKDELLSYSPECFIKIKGGKIFTYPMKGTVSADLPDAEKQLLDNKKELWEHSTIVDLLRNDLSQYAREVKVNRFRYLDTIEARGKSLLQVSSEIEGKLSPQWREQLGELLWDLLPAGSVSGAPKPKTLSIIKEAELRPRGYYTGVFGYFDGENLDSAVAIRYIEQDRENYFYWSGGGITAYSKLNEEYQELNDKIYVPTGRKY